MHGRFGHAAGRPAAARRRARPVHPGVRRHHRTARSSPRGWRWPSWTVPRGNSPTCARGWPTWKAAPNSTRTTCCVRTCWRASSSTPGAPPGCTLEGWRELQPMLHEEFALLVEGAYHEANRWLMEQGVLPEVDLRPFIRRSRTHPNAPLGWQAGTGSPPYPSDRFEASGYGQLQGGAVPSGAGYGGWGSRRDGTGAGVGDETRLMTRTAPLARSREHAEAVLGRLNRLISRHVPDFAPSTRSHSLPRPAQALSPGLARAIETARAGHPPAPGGGHRVRRRRRSRRRCCWRKCTSASRCSRRRRPRPRSGPRSRSWRCCSRASSPRSASRPACACGSRGCRCRCCAWPSPNPISSPPSTTRRGA